MTVYREVVRLGNITPLEYAELSSAPEARGMGFSVYDWKLKEPDIESRADNPMLMEKWKRTENEAIVEVGASDWALPKRERKVHKDILFVLGSVFRNKVKERQLTHPASPRFIYELQAALNHPIFKSPETPPEMRRRAEDVKEKDTFKVQYTKDELRRSPHPELYPMNVKDQTEAQRMREEFKRRIIAEPDSRSTRQRFVYAGAEKGYREADDEEEVLEYRFGRIDKG